MSVLFLLQAAPHANVVVGVVAGFIIVTVVVLIVCLLLVVKYKHKKNYSGEDVHYTAATAACFLFTVVVFPQLPLTMFAGFNLPQRAGLF